MKIEKVFGITSIAAFILFTLYSAHTGGIWEYGACYIVEKSKILVETGTIYPNMAAGGQPYPWPYNPLSLLIYTYAYIVFHVNELLISLYSAIIMVAAALIAGATASKIAKKDITLLTAGLFLAPVLITYFGTFPRVDNIAILFLSLALYHFEKGDDRKTFTFALLAFLSKQSYVFTIPLLYLLNKKYKKAAILLSAYGLTTLLLSPSPGYRENVIDYLMVETHTLNTILFIALIYFVIKGTMALSGILLYLPPALATKKKDYIITGAALFLASTYLYTKPGSATLYYYQFLLITTILAATRISEYNNKTKIALTAIITVLMFLQYGAVIEAYSPKTIKELKDISKHHTVFSDDVCISSQQYDWFLLHELSKKNLWNWEPIASSISNHEYDYIILFNTTYTGAVSQRLPESIYDAITNNYATYTTYNASIARIVVYTPTKKLINETDQRTTR